MTPSVSQSIARRALFALPAILISRSCSSAIDPIAALYDDAAATYDAQYTGSVVSRALDFDALRSSLLTHASGRVLEIGVGTGLNLPHYPATGVETFDGIDVSQNMLAIAKSRVASLKLRAPPRFRVADAAALPFEDASFDSVVDTFGLCVFERPDAVLSEAHRVLRPGGSLLLIEHDDSAVSRALDFTRGTAKVAGTCRYDQQVLSMVKSAGYAVRETRPLAGGLLREVVAARV